MGPQVRRQDLLFLPWKSWCGFLSYTESITRCWVLLRNVVWDWLYSGPLGFIFTCLLSFIILLAIYWDSRIQYSRIKSRELGMGAVKQWSGVIDVMVFWEHTNMHIELFIYEYWIMIVDYCFYWVVRKGQVADVSVLPWDPPQSRRLAWVSV